MPEGILIDYNDGRPVMAITAGLRAPSFCKSFTLDDCIYSSGRTRIDTPLSQGSEVVLIPKEPVHIIDGGQYASAVWMQSLSRNGNSGIYITNASNNGEAAANWEGSIFEILPVATYNEGLLVSDSTDFTAISNASKLMTCVYSGSVTINEALKLPVSGIPFAKWSNPDVSIGFDGTNLYAVNSAYSGRDDVRANVTIDLVIFGNKAPVAGDGITMTNSSGQVTFSTLSKPFLYSKSIEISDSFQSIGTDMVCLMFTGAMNNSIGGYNCVRRKGITMLNGQVRSNRNLLYGNYYIQGGWYVQFNANISTPILTIPNMY